MKKIKVLFFIPNLAHGGAERVLVNLVNHMDGEIFDLSVQTMFDVGIYKEKLSNSIHYIGGFPWYFRGNTFVYKLLSPKMLYKLYIKDGYDVIVSYLEGPSARVIGGAPIDQKTICWIHTELRDTDDSKYVFRNMQEAKNCYGRFDRIICVSEKVKSTFRHIFPQCKDGEVLYNTVESKVITEKSLEMIDEFVIDSDYVNLVSTGKLIKVKGFERLIRVTGRLIADGISVRLYLVGEGEERRNLEQLVSEEGLNECVSFVGFKENPYKYVKNADLFICSSYREGFSTAVTESLIVGTPVVSTRCSGAEELLGYNDEYGIVTDNDEEALYEGIKRMVTTPGLLQHYKEQAEIRGKKFSTEDTVRAVEDMLKEVAAK